MIAKGKNSRVSYDLKVARWICEITAVNYSVEQQYPRSDITATLLLLTLYPMSTKTTILLGAPVCIVAKLIR